MAKIAKNHVFGPPPSSRVHPSSASRRCASTRGHTARSANRKRASLKSMIWDNTSAQCSDLRILDGSDWAGAQTVGADRWCSESMDEYLGFKWKRRAVEMLWLVTQVRVIELLGCSHWRRLSWVKAIRKVPLVWITIAYLKLLFPISILI